MKNEWLEIERLVANHTTPAGVIEAVPRLGGVIIANYSLEERLGFTGPGARDRRFTVRFGRRLFALHPNAHYTAYVWSDLGAHGT